jgi:enterochelin esterase-like enzyme
MKKSFLCSGLAFGLLWSSASVFGADATTPANASTVAPASAAGSATGPGRGRGPSGPPATQEDLAEMAKLKDLPAYAAGLGDGDYSVGPQYSPAVEEKRRDDVPHGKIVNFVMDSTDSKIFPGNPAFTRKVAVYIPSQYVPGTPAPLIVSCDQYGLSTNTGVFQNTLDNMIADKRLPVIVAVMIASGGTERSMEYDTVSGKYAEFVESEVLPRVEKETGVTVTKDPDARMAFGGSSGGIAAFSMAWFHPELYHRVVSYSGTFVNLQHSDEVPHGGWEYHENLIAKSPVKPLRIWLEAGENDNGAQTASSAFRNWVVANKHMAEALKAKGYHYQFVFAKGAGHTDSRTNQQTIAQALEFVWKGYPVAP